MDSAGLALSARFAMQLSSVDFAAFELSVVDAEGDSGR